MMQQRASDGSKRHPIGSGHSWRLIKGDVSVQRASGPLFNCRFSRHSRSQRDSRPPQWVSDYLRGDATSATRSKRLSV